MKHYLLFVFIIVPSFLFSYFDIDEYNNFLLTHKNMSYNDLLKEYPAGIFKSNAPTEFKEAEYAKDLTKKYALTDYEIELIEKHGFMVSDRISHYTFIDAFWDVYHKDLPVYVSSDAILHALHYSFDKILIDIESRFLIKNIETVLDNFKSDIENLNIDSQDSLYYKALNDFDIYITVAQNLILNKTINSHFESNQNLVDEILEKIEAKKPSTLSLFSEKTEQIYDFSQFEVRGHYTRNESLSAYFRAMIWLGRTQIFITNPENNVLLKYSDEDLQRMAIFTAIMTESAANTGNLSILQKIDNVLNFMLGTADNVNIFETNTILENMHYSATELTDNSKYEIYKEKLLELASSEQLYNSQILYSDPMEPDQIVPPSVFLLVGQRPIIDGFITANVVYDRILFNNKKVTRMVPSTLDILFALGNDASTQLLRSDFNNYPYASNLASLRYLIDSYDDDYWNSSTYTKWLNSIRKLNPPKERDNLPAFMQTAAWWQKTMTTQLASWTELRHDFLLYTKQPYTSAIICSYPYGYVEPVPELYDNLKYFFVDLKDLIYKVIGDTTNYKTINDLANHWVLTCEHLSDISHKILNKEKYSKEDEDFFCDLIDKGHTCSGGQGEKDLGWYPVLYYGFTAEIMYEYLYGSEIPESDKFLVTDVHTIPTDEDGNPVGWVLHAGTGETNMAIIATEDYNGKLAAYAGPVYSYYEFISDDFKRLTNEEWRETKDEIAGRPEFSNLYMANSEGKQPEGGLISLDAVPVSVNNNMINSDVKISLSPNPFKDNLFIKIHIPQKLMNENLKVDIFDISGRLITNLANTSVYHNNYTLIWNRNDSQKKIIMPGAYIISVNIGENNYTEKVILE